VTPLRIADHDVYVLDVPPSADADRARAPVVAVHSTGLSSIQWRRLARRLSQSGHRVLAPDLLGYGESAAWRSNERRFETRFDLELVERLVDEAGPRVHLIGHSYGGRLAFLAAARRPERVVSLAAFEPVLFGVLASAGDHEGVAELAAYDDGTFLDEAIGGSEAWVEKFVDYWSGPGAFQELAPAQRTAFMRSARKMFEEVKETSQDTTTHDTFANLEIPTLLLSGEHSTRAGRGVCRVLAKVMPHARHLEIDGGHMAPLLRADLVNAPILDHIARAEAART
jgi:pimeloyl-ACP methyl ester carboxylesterase